MQIATNHHRPSPQRQAVGSGGSGTGYSGGSGTGTGGGVGDRVDLTDGSQSSPATANVAGQPSAKRTKQVINSYLHSFSMRSVFLRTPRYIGCRWLKGSRVVFAFVFSPSRAATSPLNSSMCLCLCLCFCWVVVTAKFDLSRQTRR
jgi:hypothetical protein